MKTKLSAIEELRLEKEKLRNECLAEEERLLYNLDYAKENIGKLLVNSLFSSTRNGISDVVSLVSGKNKNSKPKSGIFQAITSATPFIWNMLQPILIGLAVKKVKTIFTKKEKNKKRNIQKTK